MWSIRHRSVLMSNLILSDPINWIHDYHPFCVISKCPSYYHATRHYNSLRNWSQCSINSHQKNYHIHRISLHLSGTTSVRAIVSGTLAAVLWNDSTINSNCTRSTNFVTTFPISSKKAIQMYFFCVLFCKVQQTRLKANSNRLWLY